MPNEALESGSASPTGLYPATGNSEKSGSQLNSGSKEIVFCDQCGFLIPEASLQPIKMNPDIKRFCVKCKKESKALQLSESLVRHTQPKTPTQGTDALRNTPRRGTALSPEALKRSDSRKGATAENLAQDPAHAARFRVTGATLPASAKIDRKPGMSRSFRNSTPQLGAPSARGPGSSRRLPFDSELAQGARKGGLFAATNSTAQYITASVIAFVVLGILAIWIFTDSGQTPQEKNPPKFESTTSARALPSPEKKTAGPETNRGNQRKITGDQSPRSTQGREATAGPANQPAPSPLTSRTSAQADQNTIKPKNEKNVSTTKPEPAIDSPISPKPSENPIPMVKDSPSLNQGEAEEEALPDPTKRAREKEEDKPLDDRTSPLGGGSNPFAPSVPEPAQPSAPKEKPKPAFERGKSFALFPPERDSTLGDYVSPAAGNSERPSGIKEAIYPGWSFASTNKTGFQVKDGKLSIDATSCLTLDSFNAPEFNLSFELKLGANSSLGLQYGASQDAALLLLFPPGSIVPGTYDAALKKNNINADFKKTARAAIGNDWTPLNVVVRAAQLEVFIGNKSVLKTAPSAPIAKPLLGLMSVGLQNNKNPNLSMRKVMIYAP